MTGRTHAVVVGGGIAGLCTAAVLTGHFPRVTVVERDRLSELSTGAARRGVPQGPHVSLLALAGMQQLDALFPGMVRGCLADGAVAAEAGSQVRATFHGRRLRQDHAGLDILLASRPFLEERIRTRVLHHPAVTLLEGTHVSSLLAGRSHSGRSGVCGVRMHCRQDDATGRELAADLVVDATGRGARSCAWLEQLGYERAPEQRIPAGVTYASLHFALPPDILGTDRAVVIGATQRQPLGMTFVAQEAGTWVLSLQSYASRRQPQDTEQFLAAAASIAPDDVMHHLRGAKALDKVAVHRFPNGVRRHYHRLSRFPTGLLITGDALCSINPVYGSGMAMAVAQAIELDACLGQAGPLAPRFFQAAHRTTRQSWWVAACADYSINQGNSTSRLLGACFRRTMAAAARDPAVATAVVQLIGLTASPRRLASPGILRRILAPGR
ncbi:FAD-dependent oxidoreductase [Streptomyces sp. NPDC054849]